MVLVCNDTEAADTLLGQLDHQMPAVSLARLARVHGPGAPESAAQLKHDRQYVSAAAAVREIGVHKGDLPLYR
jgi:beta-N-acetylhexosaminidase